MESQEIIDEFRNQLKLVEAQGAEQVQVSALRAYLDALEKDAGASQEYRKQQHEGILAHYVAKNEYNLEMMKSVLEAGKSALHALLIINGGAVVALLGVMSNLAGKDQGVQFARYLALPLLLFGLGVLVGAIGFALRYFSQACFSESESEHDKYEKIGSWFRVAAIVAGLSGYILFGFALVNAYHAVVWSFST